MTSSPLHRYIVDLPDTEEASDFMVDAGSPEEAADLYASAVIEETIPVFLEDLEMSSVIRVRTQPTMSASPQIVEWPGFSEVPVMSVPSYLQAVRDGRVSDPESFRMS